MFEGLEGIGTLVVITVAFCTVLATFGVRLLEYLIFRMRQKKWSGDNDRRKAVAHNNPGNSSAVALGKIDLRLEGMAEDLGKLVDSVRDLDTGIKEIDRFIKAG